MQMVSNRGVERREEKDEPKAMVERTPMLHRMIFPIAPDGLTGTINSNPSSRPPVLTVVNLAHEVQLCPVVERLVAHVSKPNSTYTKAMVVDMTHSAPISLERPVKISEVREKV